MFGEGHAHLFMNGYDYRKAVETHKGHIREDILRGYLEEYRKRGITFIRDGGDNLGVSSFVKNIAAEYGIDYRTPVFAIHKNGHYGSIVGKGFDSVKEYENLVREAKRQGADFIKLMVSGLVDFSKYGVITSTPLSRDEMKELFQFAHEEGMAVMVHANGAETVRNAAECGADSIEHGRYVDKEAIEAMAEAHTIWVPTVVTVRNLIGCGRFPDEIVRKIYETDCRNIRLGKEKGVTLALGSDAGAYMVPHGKGLEDEYRTFQDIFGESEEWNEYLERGEKELRERFLRS
ncbi:Xaa-Pro dipeptidase [Blautia sp. OF03-15BH]|uniref:amidohydrolase family protein n=1 Tax=Blautia sp. OF03-15BH TaxID=2292287 RepID=UPI000E516D3B|nr:amidohydrolase family protein [Blautia sp. OF03-15BH]RGY03071.1 Xaa-Pro dipeptidase [Blautia sp. OF03-15BH]